MDADTKNKVTVVGVVGALITAAGFVWSQWNQGVGDFVKAQPLVAALVVAGRVLQVGRRKFVRFGDE